MKSKILIVDDELGALKSLSRALMNDLNQVDIFLAHNLKLALELVAEHQPAVCVIDLSIDSMQGVESGFELLAEIVQRDQSARVIVLTGHGSLQYGVRALQLGAANFLEKPANIPHLAALIRDGLNQAAIKRAYQDLKESQAQELQGLSGNSVLIEKVKQELSFAAKSRLSVLLLGETGTGKSLCASLIHANSKRAQRRFVRWQPSFASPDLVNSELFGHAKGSFTGAVTERQGLIQEADGGTLFLDEVEELPLETQVALLGVLQDRCFRAVGSNNVKQVDFRLVCACNEDPQKLIDAGKLRRDFYHRIAHLPIKIASLRERLEDLAGLAEAFLIKLRQREHLNVFSILPEVLSTLRSCSWPGNIRELEAVIEGAAFRAQFNGRTFIANEDLRLDREAVTCSADSTFGDKVENYKYSLVREALLQSAGNQVQAAKLLGLDRSTLRRILGRN